MSLRASFHSSAPSPLLEKKKSFSSSPAIEKRKSLSINHSSDAIRKSVMVAQAAVLSTDASGGAPTHIGTSLPPIDDSTPRSPRSIVAAQKPIFSKQLFGENKSERTRSELGMMYRARLTENSQPKVKQTRRRSLTGAPGEASQSFTSPGGDTSMTSLDVIDSDEESANEVESTMNPRQQLAMTIKNWSTMRANDEYLILEGAVDALIALATVDDPLVKRCCASAFYNLSSRDRNRRALLSLGMVTGVIQIAMQIRNWKIAKLCAMTLCNLSMEEGGEPTMAKEGAILALVILLGVKGSRLLPICIQALYNLTCVPEEDFFKGMDRIVRAILNIPMTTFDHTPYLVKTIVNCSRFSWLRSRFIEDGVLGSLGSLVESQNFSSRTDLAEYVSNIVSCLAALSEVQGTSQCRVDMIQKGAVEILNKLLPFCPETTYVKVIIVLHNLVEIVKYMSNHMFETAVHIVIDMLNATDDPTVLQYCSSCFYTFTKERMRNIHGLTAKVIEIMPKLFLSTDPLTQHFTISSAGTMFFNGLCDSPQMLELLTKNFVEAIALVKDPEATQALSLALSKMVSDTTYTNILERNDLFHYLIDQLLSLLETYHGSGEAIVQETSCISVTRIALKLEGKKDAALRKRIANVLFNLLETDEQYVLVNCVMSIRALGERGLCHEELRSNELFVRLARIVSRYRHDFILCRNCAAVLAVFSFDSKTHTGLSEDSVMDVLFETTRAEDPLTRELVATTLCNISGDRQACKRMIEKGVIDVLGTLSGTTSELIQELCAKTMCNLTCITEYHAKIIEQNLLQTLLMIALLRAVSFPTKLLCARALLNLTCDEANADALRDTGAIRVFANLSTIGCPLTQSTCARGFLALTGSENRRLEVIQRRMVVQALFGLVRASQAKTRIIAGMAVCNLLACPRSQKAAMKAGGLSVLKIIATMDCEELREATVRVMITMTHNASLHRTLLKEPVVQALVLIMQNSSAWTFECTINAFACLSQAEAFRVPLAEKGCIAALVGAVITGRVFTTQFARIVCRCLTLLSYHAPKVPSMITSGNILVALHAMHRAGLVMTDTAVMMTILLHNFSLVRDARGFLMAQDAFRLLVRLSDFFVKDYTLTFKASVIFMYNISQEANLHELLMEQGYMRMLRQIVAPGILPNDSLLDPSLLSQIQSVVQSVVGSMAGTPLGGSIRGSFVGTGVSSTFTTTGITILSESDVTFVAKSINSMSESESCRMPLVDGNILHMIARLLGCVNDEACFMLTSAICNMASSKHCRESLVRQGAADVLISLSSLSSDTQTRLKCSLALGYLSETTKLNDGIASSLLELSLKGEEVAATTGQLEMLVQPRKQSVSLAPILKKRLAKLIRQHKAEIIKSPSLASTPMTRSLTDDSTFLMHKHGDDEKIGSKEKNYITFNRQERDLLFADYSAYEYETIFYSAIVEPGGMANKTNTEMPLPSIATDRNLEQHNRVPELTKVPLRKAPLPKVFGNTSDGVLDSIQALAKGGDDSLEDENAGDDVNSSADGSSFASGFLDDHNNINIPPSSSRSQLDSQSSARSGHRSSSRDRNSDETRRSFHAHIKKSRSKGRLHDGQRISISGPSRSEPPAQGSGVRASFLLNATADLTMLAPDRAPPPLDATAVELPGGAWPKKFGTSAAMPLVKSRSNSNLDPPKSPSKSSNSPLLDLSKSNNSKGDLSKLMPKSSRSQVNFANQYQPS